MNSVPLSYSPPDIKSIITVDEFRHIIDVAKETVQLPKSYGTSFFYGSNEGKIGLLFQSQNGYIHTVFSSPVFSSCLRLSRLPPALKIGYISNGSIHIFEIEFGKQIELLPIRRLRHVDPFDFFDFGLDDKIWTLSQSLVFQFLYNKNDPILKREINDGAKGLGIVASPINPNSALVLCDNGRLIVLRGINSYQILHGCSNAKEVAWSPLGSTIIIFGDNDPIHLVEVSENIWQVATTVTRN